MYDRIKEMTSEKIEIEHHNSAILGKRVWL
jgi:hypothetical protein